MILHIFAMLEENKSHPAADDSNNNNRSYINKIH